MFLASYQSKDPAILNELKEEILFNVDQCDYFSAESLQINQLVHSKLPRPSSPCFQHDKSSGISTYLSGTIYNKQELIQSHALEENSSCINLIVKLFLKLGPTFVEQLNGDFVIFIHAAQSNELFVFRDHLGIIPVSYTIVQDACYFSSDHVGLCKYFQTEANTDFEVLLSGFKYLSPEKSLNSDVKKIKPGHYLQFQQGKVREIKYWFPEKIKVNKKMTRERLLEETKSLIQDAVLIRSTPKYLAAAHVSGGLDSSYVAAIARELYTDQQPFYGLSWSPEHADSEGLAFDERLYVRGVCERNRMTPIFYDNTQIKTVLENPVYHPTLGSFDEEIILKYASEHGVNLIFSGWGGDDFISVSNHGMLQDLFFQCKWKAIFKGLSLKKKLKLVLYDVLLPYFRIIPRSVLRDLETTRIYLKPAVQKSDLKQLKSICSYRSRREIHLNGLSNGHLAERTEITYNMASRFGIEYRFPLLDKRIIEYLLSVPSASLFHPDHTRTVLRSVSEEELPEDVRFRKTKQDLVVEDSLNHFFEQFDRDVMENLTEIEQGETAFFFNFEQLRQDWEKFKLQQNQHIDQSTLLCAIYEVKMIHDFIKTYKNDGKIHTK